MPYETNTAKVVARLAGNRSAGASTTSFRKSGVWTIMVPRHRTLTPGVAQSIAKAAGWTK